MKSPRSAVPVFHPEYGRFMLESTPGEPYNGSVNDLLSVECNMRFRWCNRHNPLRSIHSSDELKQTRIGYETSQRQRTPSHYHLLPSVGSTWRIHGSLL
jgi:hypothetical protein